MMVKETTHFNFYVSADYVSTHWLIPVLPILPEPSTITRLSRFSLEKARDHYVIQSMRCCSLICSDLQLGKRTFQYFFLLSRRETLFRSGSRVQHSWFHSVHAVALQLCCLAFLFAFLGNGKPAVIVMVCVLFFYFLSALLFRTLWYFCIAKCLQTRISVVHWSHSVFRQFIFNGYKKKTKQCDQLHLIVDFCWIGARKS